MEESAGVFSRFLKIYSRKTNHDLACQSYGNFHQQYRNLEDRRALHVLPLVAKTDSEFRELTQSIISGKQVPDFVGPIAKRTIGSLASAPGAALTAYLLDLVEIPRKSSMAQNTPEKAFRRFAPAKNMYENFPALRAGINM